MTTWQEAVDRFQQSLERLPTRWRKPAYFAAWGAAGCLLGALLVGELLLAMALPPPPVKPKVDILFVLDATASMQFAIDGVRAGIRDFAEGLGKEQLDSRIGLVAFRDEQNPGEDPVVLEFAGGPLTDDLAEFRKKVAQLHATGGGDVPETSLEALRLASQQPFRPKSTRVLVLITDAPPKHLPEGFASVHDAASSLEVGGISQVHLVIKKAQRPTYAPLQDKLKGQVYSLEEAARPGGFDAILPQLGSDIARETIGGLQSSRQVDREQRGRLMLAIGLWTAALAIALALALIAAQNIYLRREPLPKPDLLKGGLGGFAAGLGAGFAGQFVYQMVPYFPFRLLGWGLLGALVGGGMSFFVPNLDRRKALLGGALGGAIGCVGYLIASGLAGDVGGRLLGAALLGGCIGAMIGLVETAFRDAWLEVAYGPEGKEKRTVSLGREPVSVGSDRTCKVWSRDAAPVAYRYKLEAGRITCEDVAGKQTQLVKDGDRRAAGKLTVIVRTASMSGANTTSTGTTPEPTPSGLTPKPGNPAPPAQATQAGPIRPSASKPTSGLKPSPPGPVSKPSPPTPTPARPPASEAPPADLPSTSSPSPPNQPLPSRRPTAPPPPRPGPLKPPSN
ncbi:MAG: VWA domain-containing protein [Isosphaeraceae bacterium]